MDVYPYGTSNTTRSAAREGMLPETTLDVSIISVDGDPPPARGGHSAVTVENQIIIFGGSSYVSGGKFAYYNDTRMLDTRNRLWHEMHCSGETPAPRYGHSAELVGSRMFVWGGRGEAGTLQDISFLDLVEWTWISVSVTSASPAPRFFHASLLLGRKIVIHGGWDGHMQCMDDIWVFDSDTFTWLQPKCLGIAPTPRYGHSLDLLRDGRILCCGGCTVSPKEPVPKYHNDFGQLNTETMMWTKFSPNGNCIPSKRYGHATVRSDRGIAIFGGWGIDGQQYSDFFFFLSDDQLLPCSPAGLSHKYGHTMNAIGRVLYVFGGWNGQQATSDLIQIQPST